MTTEKDFNRNISIIKKAGEHLADSIHAAGLFAIAQANEHGNIGFATRLIDAMGKKHDRQRVVNWLVAFGKIGVKQGILVFHKRKDIVPETMEAFLGKADKCPYWEYTKAKPLFEKVDYLEMLKSIVSKHKRIAEGETTKEYQESHIDILPEVEKLIARLTKKEEKVTPVLPSVAPVAG